MAHRVIDHPELAGMPQRRKIKPGFTRPGTAIDVEVLKITGDLVIRPIIEIPDLYEGDRMIVTVTSPDGVVLCTVTDAALVGGSLKVKELDGMKWRTKQWTLEV